MEKVYSNVYSFLLLLFYLARIQQWFRNPRDPSKREKKLKISIATRFQKNGFHGERKFRKCRGKREGTTQWKKMIKYDSNGKIKKLQQFQTIDGKIVSNHYRPSWRDKRKLSNEARDQLSSARNPFPLARIEPETRVRKGKGVGEDGIVGRQDVCDVFIAGRGGG